MDNFIVSARKYRPATFETVVGQQHITNTLKNAIKNNQLAQAFLLCGARGVGKNKCARILGKNINSENLKTNREASGGQCGEDQRCGGYRCQQVAHLVGLQRNRRFGVCDALSEEAFFPLQLLPPRLADIEGKQFVGNGQSTPV